MPSILNFHLYLLLQFFFVLNLVINGMPSIRKQGLSGASSNAIVLNLVINGMPSILGLQFGALTPPLNRFKPCYKWNAFNTLVNNISFFL